MLSAHLEVLEVLEGFAGYYQKRYAFPSQETILEQLATYHGRQICRSTLNLWLKDLEERSYFRRIRRHKRAEDGHMLFRSTLYKFTGKTLKRLASLANRAAWLASSLRVRFIGQYKPSKGTGCRAVPLLEDRSCLERPQEGGPPGTFGGISSPTPDENLLQVRNLLKNIG